MKKLLLAFLLLVGIAPPLVAQTVFNQGSIANQVAGGPVNITTTGNTTIYTGGTRGSICYGGTLNWNDQTATHLLTFGINRSGTLANYASYLTFIGLPGGTLSTPVNMFGPAVLNNGGTAPNMVFPLTYNGMQAFTLKSGDLWVVNVATAVTGGTAIFILGHCADFQ